MSTISIHRSPRRKRREETGMVLYEVNIRVLSEIAPDYEVWLDEHIREILKIDGFVSAEWFVVEDDIEARELEEAVRNAVRLDESIPAEIREAAATPVHTSQYTVQYRLKNRQAFDQYLNVYADQMREDGISKFGSRFAASRRVLNLKEVYQTKVS